MFFNLATVQVQELEFLILKSNRTPGEKKRKGKSPSQRRGSRRARAPGRWILEPADFEFLAIESAGLDGAAVVVGH